MSAIETLIKIKKQSTTDDLIVFLDEVILYEKLSKSSTLKDLKKSKAAQKKLPLLSGAYKGDLYSLSMLQVVRNIISHLDRDVPEVLQKPFEDMASKEKRRLEAVESNVIKAFYHSLYEYDHDVMKDQVVAVFIEEMENEKNAVLIIVRNGDQYEIYQGYYDKKEGESDDRGQSKAKPYVCKDGDCSLSIFTYSMQGNNAYPFATFTHLADSYSVMRPKHDELWLFREETDETLKWLVPNEQAPLTIHMTMEQRNALEMSKSDIHAFCGCVISIVRKGMNIDEAVNDDSETRAGDD